MANESSEKYISWRDRRRKYYRQAAIKCAKYTVRFAIE
ncbi:hypothetical protein CSC17_5681 [Klebsiella oxytoca]|nr:hypothetical protein CSC17_5681 [Klebsiella oxytoca]